MSKRFRKDRGRIWDNGISLSLDDVVNLLNDFDESNVDLYSNNETLRQEVQKQAETIKELCYDDPKEKLEIEYINNIYKELGFDGVIDYAKRQLLEYGAVVEVETGLWKMATGGWSDHESWIYCLNNILSLFNYKHYVGYTRGGAYYYTKDPHKRVKVILEED